MFLRTLAALVLLPAAFAQYRRGVNISGAEFGMNTIPGRLGTEYTFNSEGTFRYFGEKKLGLIRVPLLWERLQPVLRGPLDSDYLANLKKNVAWAKAHGGEVIIDIHNFARYSFNEAGGLKTYIIDNVASDGTVKVSSADFADLWVRLSNEFKFEPTVYAYDLVNEPHDMGSASWKTISQTTLNAIRANQDDKLILIPGDSWSSANRWMTVHGPTAWIQDPADNFAYEAHNYFDHDESGSYALSYDAELAGNSDLANVGRTRVSHFIAWCRANNVRGIVDEYGIPSGDDRWGTVIENFFAALDEAAMDGAYWAAGEWWGNYGLSVQPTSNFTVDRPQMKNLTAHAGTGSITAVSAASLSVARATAGSLVTIYGSSFTDRNGASTGALAYPITLADVSVDVTDFAGRSQPAGLLYASPSQLNIQMPGGLAAGRATLAVRHLNAVVAIGGIYVATTGPAIITINSAGYGIAAAQVIRIKPDGSQTYEPVAQIDGPESAIVPVPIDFGPAGDRLFLALYGTGIRGTTAAAKIGDVDAPVQYAGPQGLYPGLDQVNLELSRSLAGSGHLNIAFSSDGVAANPVGILFK